MRHAALAIRPTMASLMTSRITSMNLVEHPVPPGPGEEVRDNRYEALQCRAGSRLFVVLAPGLVRPVDEERLALDVITRQKAPVAAVLRVVAVVAHDEVAVRGHRHRAVALADVVRRHLVQLR